MLMEWEVQFEQIDESRPIVRQLLCILRDLIIRNVLKPDEKLSESEIAARFGVSRQPVREAFIRLADDGLLSILPQRPTRVRRIDLAEVAGARFIREAVEADIVRILADAPDAAPVAELRDLVDQQRRLKDDDALAFIAADETFHRALAGAAGKSVVWERLQGLKAQMDRVRFLALEQFPIRKLIEQHAAIVDGIATGDAALAETALRLHLREVLKDLQVIAQVNPGVFASIPDGVEDRVVVLQGGETK